VVVGNSTFVIAGQEVRPGCNKTVELQIPELYTHTPMVMPVHVVHGKKPGPVVFISGALHGDELTGTAVIRRLMQNKLLGQIFGTLLLVPIVNMYGFIHQSRYLPDRRDLNRCFPGSESGSLAARLAKLFMDEIVSLSSHGIDLHSGAIHRTNLPQIRANLEHPESRDMAMAFGAPVVLHSGLRDGSLRQAVDELGIPVILYEAGEALRLDEYSLRTGVKGIIEVLRSLSVIAPSRRRSIKAKNSFVALSSSWLRSQNSGMVFLTVALGDYVEDGETLGEIVDPLSERSTPIVSHQAGIVIGRSQIPLTNEGDALVHVAEAQAGIVAEELADLVSPLSSDGDIFP